MSLTILHTGDIHGRVDALARVATLIERLRAAEPERAFLYLDTGDVEDTSTPISNVTKGAAMHRLLGAAGCSAAAVGNAGWLRYGTQVLAEHAAAGGYPLLLGNVRTQAGDQLPGTSSTVLLEAGGLRLGLVGVTSRMAWIHDDLSLFGVSLEPSAEVIREAARRLRSEGAELVVVLSHLGLEAAWEPEDDRRLARALEGQVDLVLGGHTHDLLPEGEWVGGVLLAHAGDFGAHLGRVDLTPGGPRASVLAVPGDTPLHPAVLAAVAAAERDVEATLAETIGRLDAPLDAAWVAEAFRQRMGAEVGLAIANHVLHRPLSVRDRLTRGELWEVCDSPANPGVTTMTGEQLREVLERGRDPAFAGERPRALRGHSRGVLLVSGPDRIDPTRSYRVAGTDYELEHYGGLVPREWGLSVHYDFPTIVREAIEEHLRR